ncbi:hypothetical protein [Bradyrhizobium sp. 6(2017)]|uniref:hypothetical protein n=1 Tax=Bradyrhizobium sp. 6(2017) TaxID=1197460 RepID=UPI0013E191B6|nr:hypothetical protein [Bradyrhizobium sp. 6(2017)]QIG92278.1 hypothetical protein G6P99_07025 [Bradyrhizobium sp. 6(2017)]
MTIAEFNSPQFNLIGMPVNQLAATPLGNASISENNLGAANAAYVAIGDMWWDDHGSHTIDTSGSSLIGFQLGSGTWANGGSTLKVGIASLDTSNGPTGRPVNSSGVITPDVAAVITGGSGLTQLAWNDVVPTTGTRTIAQAERIAIFLQLTARAGSDALLVRSMPNAGFSNGIPNVCTYNGSSFVGQQLTPNFELRAHDGVRGALLGTYLISSGSSKSWNNTSTPKEYANIVQVPYACKAYGVVMYGNVSGDFDYVLYEDPLGTPVARASGSVDANTVAGTGVETYNLAFTTGFGWELTPGVPYAVAIKPTSGSNVSMNYMTFANVAHQASVPGGDNGYAVSRSTGAFSAQNSSLDRFFLGLRVGGGNAGGGGSFSGVICG